MAFDIDATSDATVVLDATSISWSHTCAASSNKLVLVCGNGLSVAAAQRDVSSCTYNGDACTQIVQSSHTSWASSAIYKRDSPDTGSAFTAVFNFSEVQSQIAASAISFIDAEATDGAGFEANGTTANPSVTVTDSANGDIVLGVLFSDTGPDATTNADGTEIFEHENINSDSDYSFQRFTATGANQVVSWTCSDTANAWAIAAVAIKGVAGGGQPLMGRKLYILP